MRSYNYWLGCWILDYARQHRRKIWCRYYMRSYNYCMAWLLDSGLCQAAPPQDLAGRSQCRYYIDLITTGLAAGFWTMPGSTAAGSGWQVTVHVLHRSYNYWLGCWILDYARQHRRRIWLAGHSAGIIITGLATCC
jgi:hypothetical protein